jgi:hypothetical protein
MFRVVISILVSVSVAMCALHGIGAETEQPAPTIVPAGAGVVAVVDASGVSDPVGLCQGGRRLAHVLADRDVARDRLRKT